MNCCGKKSRRYKKKKTANDREKESKKVKLAIWNQMYFIASMSIYYEQQNLRSLDEHPPDFFVSRYVYLYDVTESGMRDMELDAFYSFYLSQAQFEKTPKSAILHQIHYFGFREIMKAYKMFEIVNYSEKSEIKRDIIVMRLQEFFDSLRFLPRFESQASSGYFKKPVTLYECTNLEILAEESSTTRGFTSTWLQLMSWWRLVKVQLQKQIRQLARLRKNQSSSQFFNESAESIDYLDALMANLDLHHGSAELAALRQCLHLTKNISDGKVFIPSYECDVGTPKDILLCGISADSRLIALVAGCCYQNINICFKVQQVIVSKLEDADLLESITTTLKLLVVEFFFEVISPLRIGIKFERYTVLVTENCVQIFKDYILTLKRTRDDSEIVKNPLQNTIQVWTLTLQLCIDISMCGKQILTLYGDQTQTVITCSIKQLLLDVIRTGVLLAHKVFQNDFVSENILLELAEHELKIHNEGLFDLSCAQVAYCLVSAYRIMHNRCPCPEGCFWLPEDFLRKEFVAFIDEIRRTCGLQQLDTDAMLLRHELHEVQHVLSRELSDELRGLTVLARSGNELLEGVKHFEDS